MHKENPPPYSTAPPPPGFVHPPQPQPPLQPTHVVITSLQHVQHVPLGPNSQPMRCPSCNQMISTEVTLEPNTRTHLIAVILCALGMWCCCCLPYCMDSCQSRKHNCPNCGAYIGEYSN